MHEWLILLSEYAITLINFIALAVIVFATLQALVVVVRAAFLPLERDERGRVWLRYARWLVVALTFQLAADIVETAITTDWEAIGRVAVIAVIRTFLNYFLERDMTEVRDLRAEAHSARAD
jgi:uncharacterized membrane protein